MSCPRSPVPFGLTSLCELSIGQRTGRHANQGHRQPVQLGHRRGRRRWGEDRLRGDQRRRQSRLRDLRPLRPSRRPGAGDAWVYQSPGPAIRRTRGLHSAVPGVLRARAQLDVHDHARGAMSEQLLLLRSLRAQRITRSWLVTSGLLLLGLALAGGAGRLAQATGGNLLPADVFYEVMSVHGSGMVAIGLMAGAALLWQIVSDQIEVKVGVHRLVYLLTLAGLLIIVVAVVV